MPTVELHKGDCLEVMPTLEAGSFDAIIADLPYGTTACRWDTIIPFEPLWEQYKRLIKPRGAIVLFGSQPFTSVLVMSNPGWFRYEWVWDKKRATGGALAKTRPMKAHENILVFSEMASTYNPQMTDFTHDERLRMRKHDARCKAPPTGGSENISRGWYIGKKKTPLSVIRVPALGAWHPERKVGKHPTQKPIKLLEYLIRTYTNEGDTVLDNCFGSCTTGVACVNLGRHFVGIEQDEEYFELGRERINTALSQPRQLEFTTSMHDAVPSPPSSTEIYPYEIDF